MDAFIAPVVSGVVCGLIAWGGVRVELRWLRRDVDLAHERINQLDARCLARAQVELGQRPGAV